MKNSYILLRDNTESSSLSLEELKAIGLLPTDRIWIECQSVGWRNPLEIKELKKLVITTQPVDQSNESDTPDDRIAGSKQSNVAKKRNKILAGMTVTNRLGLRKKQKTSIKWTEEELHQSDKDDLTGDVLKEQGRKKNFRLPASVKKIALYMGLIISGALLVLLIQRIETKPATTVQQAAPENENNTVVKATMPVTNNEDSVPLPIINEVASLPLSDENDKVVKAPVKQDSDTQTVPLVSANKTTPPELSKNTPEKKSNPVIEKKEPLITTESIAARLTLQANEYKVGAFGGIKDLTMTLQNKSPYLVDKVTVEVSYLNPDGNALKTEEVFFQSLKPGDAISLEVDKYKRGVKVSYRIIDIESKAITNNSSRLNDGENVSKN